MAKNNDGLEAWAPRAEFILKCFQLTLGTRRKASNLSQAEIWKICREHLSRRGISLKPAHHNLTTSALPLSSPLIRSPRRVLWICEEKWFHETLSGKLLWPGLWMIICSLMKKWSDISLNCDRSLRDWAAGDTASVCRQLAAFWAGEGGEEGPFSQVSVEGHTLTTCVLNDLFGEAKSRLLKAWDQQPDNGPAFKGVNSFQKMFSCPWRVVGWGRRGGRIGSHRGRQHREVKRFIWEFLTYTSISVLHLLPQLGFAFSCSMCCGKWNNNIENTVMENTENIHRGTI